MTSQLAPEPAKARRTPTRPGDRVFFGISFGAALVILLTLAGVAIFLTTLAFNFLGDGLRDALDPKSK